MIEEQNLIYRAHKEIDSSIVKARSYSCGPLTVCVFEYGPSMQESPISIRSKKSYLASLRLMYSGEINLSFGWTQWARR